MTVTYVYSDIFHKEIPMLHTVRTTTYISYADIYNWCLKNCKAKFYVLPSWSGNGCQFEDNEDAAMFALRWT